MKSDDIRSSFLSFFQEKGHEVKASSSLIPRGDPTLLLTTAGMVQFKPYFLGYLTPDNPRLTSCQKCFRTTDIDEVGDATHLTFFEMLGNFSIGDYFKEEAIAWAWEFVTERLKLPPERLWITIFLDDDEAYSIWQKIGIPDSKILRFGEDNYWGPAGDSGPCGPCSEIHYDFGKEIGCGRSSCGPNCNCGRFSEIWNLVFMQFDQDKNGNRTPLPKPNIDTGMGLERTTAVLQQKRSVYDTDLFLPILEQIKYLKGSKSDAGDDTVVRIIAEHIRGLTFLTGDGVNPSNEGRGYVLRRLLRRAILYGRKLGLESPFINEVVNVVINKLGHVYPELIQRRELIQKRVEDEEVRFGETLATGLELLDVIMSETATKVRGKISGEQVFRLYDTHGFPAELTGEIASERGFSVDMDGFNNEMAKQRQRTRQQPAGGEMVSPTGGVRRSKHSERDINKYDTEFVGYDLINQQSVEAEIIEVLSAKGPLVKLNEGQKGYLILNRTPFYGEMGGQTGDTGEIRGRSGKFEVHNTRRTPRDEIIHEGKVISGVLKKGDQVEAEVDRRRRLDIARNHTATHLLQFALREVLGKHVQQHGSLVDQKQFRFDFSQLVGLTPPQLERIHDLVNEKIRQNIPVYAEQLEYKEAVAEGAIALFDEKYGDKVRVLKIGDPVISAELCGGTHVAATGEIGFFQIVSEASIGSGLRRIVAVTGKEAVALAEKRFSSLRQLANILDTSPDKVERRITGLVTELQKERRRVQTLEGELVRIRANKLVEQVEVVNGVNLVVAKMLDLRVDILREICDFIRERLKSVIIVLATIHNNRPLFVAAVTQDLVSQGFNAGHIVGEVARVVGGGGGGKPTLAQAGGKDKTKIDEALRKVRTLI